MRKLFTYIVFAAAVLATGTGCSRAKDIPRGELKEIFKEAFLINAYYQTNPRMMEAMMMDSLDIYRPILERYGYTLRDLEYTVQNISKQKSKNLSDVVEKSIEELKKESEWFDQRIADMDTVSARAGRIFMQEVLFEEQITAEEIKDTAKLRIILPVKEGTYAVSYAYLLDSLEQNGSLRITGTVYDTVGRRRSVFSQVLSKRGRQRPEPHRFDTTAADSTLVLLLGNYPKTMGRPHLIVDSLRLDYFLPAQKAQDSLRRMLYHPNFPPYYGEEDPVAQDSSALRPDAVGVDTVGTADPR